MKKLAISLLAAVICSVVSVSCAQQRLFSDFSTTKGVTTVFVGKTMLKLAGGVAKKKVGKDSDSEAISKALSSASSIEILSADEDASADIKKQILERFNNDKYEILTEVNDDGEKVRILGELVDDETLSKVIIISEENNELDVIVANGKFSISDFATMANQ